MFVLAVMGSGVMYLLLGWLGSAIIASLFSGEKGYGERPGLASGLILPPLAVLAWLVIPARGESDWKVAGPSTASTVAMAVSAVVGLGALVAAFVADVDGIAMVLLIVYGIAMLVAAAIAFATSRSPDPTAAVAA